MCGNPTIQRETPASYHWSIKTDADHLINFNLCKEVDYFNMDIRLAELQIGKSVNTMLVRERMEVDMYVNNSFANTVLLLQFTKRNALSQLGIVCINLQENLK